MPEGIKELALVARAKIISTDPVLKILTVMEPASIAGYTSAIDAKTKFSEMLNDLKSSKVEF
jgi:hypothetical protein